MIAITRTLLLSSIIVLVGDSALAQLPNLLYLKKGTRHETLLATLHTHGLPTFVGDWHFIGPFDNTGGAGFAAVYPPEKRFELSAIYHGKNGQTASWRKFPDFRIGQNNNLRRFRDNAFACVYLHHVIELKTAQVVPMSIGSDDGVCIWLNGERILAENQHRGAAPDQNFVVFNLKAGKNTLLVKVCNEDGGWAFYMRPMLPPGLEEVFQSRLDDDFPPPRSNEERSALAAENAHYRMTTVPVPVGVVLEVGGLAFRPDGKLLACTRRGDIWLISNLESPDPKKIHFHRWATGLHEALGVVVDGPRSCIVVQRPELTRILDRDGDEFADEYVPICDRWGISGDYHEFAFGPARDKQGNSFVTLNVGFGGGHQSKAPWRGWCVKITPQGQLVPVATGLRSPNGLNFNPEGDLFYTDNQGEWVATNKMHHIREGEFYGHPAGLRWVPESPFASSLRTRVTGGMRFDGLAGENGVRGMPPLTPPCIQFPYARMGQSASEPIWDTTGGKFGPFAGQCLVGDQMRASIMRVALEKVNGRYQGACFPFRGGFDCGVNRLTFAPDGSLYAGMTARGWGSVGGKPFGLQRLAYTGVLPFEILTMKLTPSGFDLLFTKPIDPSKSARPEDYSLQSFTYYYWSTYGSPEIDRRAEKIESMLVSPDRRTVTLRVANLKPGRVYELHADRVFADDGKPLLHAEAYYTLNSTLP